MGSRKLVAITVVVCSVLPYLSSSAPPNESSAEYIAEEEFSPRDSRQFSFITTPFRRVANSTRTIVKFIRDYSTARLNNGTTPVPQTNAGRRAVAVLKHVTLDNLRDAVSTLANSDAGPVVVDFIRSIDRDTLQLFNSPARTAPPLLLKLRTTTVPPTTKAPRTRRTRRTTTEASKTKSNSTISSVTEKAGTSNVTVTTISPLGAEKSTKGYALSVVEHIRNTASSGIETGKVPVNEVEDDEDDSTEDD